MKSGERKRVELQGRTVDYRIVRSKAARHLRVRVGPNGVEVVQPSWRRTDDAADFLRANGKWLCKQLDRVQPFHAIRKRVHEEKNEILFRGRPTRIRIDISARRSVNRIIFENGEIVIKGGTNCPTPIGRSLENWLRKQARREIEEQLVPLTGRLKRSPNRVYVMGQRTKWGNCSARKNLSFNWRLIMAPEFVLRYFIAHEMAHLAVPDHSAKFWLTVHSLCPETQKARQWLRVNGHRLMNASREYPQSF